MQPKPVQIPRKARGRHEVNLRRVAHRLQQALCAKGIRVKINQVQSYSEKAERMVNKYVIIQTEKQMDGRNKNTTLLESYQLAEVVKLLAGLYKDA